MQGKAKNVDILDDSEYKKQTLTIVQDFRKKNTNKDVSDNIEMIQKKEKDLPNVEAPKNNEAKKDDGKKEIELTISQDFHKKKTTNDKVANDISLVQDDKKKDDVHTENKEAPQADKKDGKEVELKIVQDFAQKKADKSTQDKLGLAQKPMKDLKPEERTPEKGFTTDAEKKSGNVELVIGQEFQKKSA